MTGGLPPGIAAPPRRRGRWVWAALLALVTLLAWAPVLSVTFTVIAADWLGCRVHEGFPTPCPGPFGQDWGGLLYTTGVLGWLMLATAPVMLLTLLAWIIILLRWVIRRLRRT